VATLRSVRQTLAHAERCGDPLRQQIIRTASLRTRAFTHMHTVESEFRAAVDQAMAEREPALAAWANDLLGLAASNASHFTVGIERQLRACDAAQETGQAHRALFAMMNLGVSFNNLGDHQSSLDWLEKGIAAARAAGWPACIGMLLMQTAEPLRMLGRHEVARSMLDEALEILAPFDRTHNYSVALLYLSELQVDTGDHAGALDTIARIEALGRGTRWTGPTLMAQCGKAEALSCLDRPDEALEVAQAALASARAQNDAYNEIDALHALADIHARHRLPPPPGATAPRRRPARCIIWSA